MTWQSDNLVSCDRVQWALCLIPVLGLCLILAGCAVTAQRATIRHKERARARMERQMKPPLPESGLALWWAENGKAAMGIAAALLGAGGLANRVKG